MPRKKRNRCKVKSCNVVIDEKYHFCYHHRKWSLHDVKTQMEEQEPAKQKKPQLKRYFCDPCGTVSFAASYTDCKMCGHNTEALDG